MLLVVSLATIMRGAFGLCLGIQGESPRCKQPAAPYDGQVVLPTAAYGMDSMRDVDVFFAPRGLPTGLPLLRVAYDGGRVLLRGGGNPRNNSADAFLGQVPSVTWDATRIATAMVVFIDLDCGGRRRVDSEPGSCGPALHSMWSDCSGGNLNGCRTVVPYRPPGVGRGTNRYVWLMLEQPVPLARSSLPVRPRSVPSWDLVSFLKLNPKLQLSAYNLMHVTGYGTPAWKKKRGGRRRRTSG